MKKENMALKIVSLLILIIAFRGLITMYYKKNYMEYINKQREVVDDMMVMCVENNLSLVENSIKKFQEHEFSKIDSFSKIDEQKLLNNMKEHKEMLGIISAIYLGTEENLIYGIYDDRSKYNKEFKNQRWYKEAKQNNSITYTTVDNSTGKSMLISYPIIGAHEKTIGVLCVELKDSFFNDICGKYNLFGIITDYEIKNEVGELLHKRTIESKGINSIIQKNSIEVDGFVIDITYDVGNNVFLTSYIDNLCNFILLLASIWVFMNIKKKKNINDKALLAFMLVLFVFEFFVTYVLEVNEQKAYMSEYSHIYLDFIEDLYELELQDNQLCTYMSMYEISEIYNKDRKDNNEIIDYIMNLKKKNPEIIASYLILEDSKLILPNNIFKNQDLIIDALSEKMLVNDDDNEINNVKLLFHNELDDKSLLRENEVICYKIKEVNGTRILVAFQFLADDMIEKFHHIIEKTDNNENFFFLTADNNLERCTLENGEKDLKEVDFSTFFRNVNISVDKEQLEQCKKHMLENFSGVIEIKQSDVSFYMFYKKNLMSNVDIIIYNHDLTKLYLKLTLMIILLVSVALLISMLRGKKGVKIDIFEKAANEIIEDIEKMKEQNDKV